MFNDNTIHFNIGVDGMKKDEKDQDSFVVPEDIPIIWVNII